MGTFNNYRKGDGSKVGGKISSLGELLAAEVPGSPGFALEVEGHTYFLDHNPDLRYFMAAELENMDSADEAEAMVHSERIRHAIMAASLPDVIVREISDGYKLLGPGAVVAVRSSATAEDLPDNAFAGQQDTVLGVRGVQNICAAILKCYASLFNYRAYLYRRENGIVAGSPPSSQMGSWPVG